jgi:hypothetical protein
VNTYNEIKSGLDEQSKGIADNVAKQVNAGTTAELQASKAAVEAGLQQLNGVWDAGIFSNDSRAKLQGQLDGLNAELAKRAAVVPNGVAASLDHGEAQVTAAAGRMTKGVKDKVRLTAQDAAAAGKKIPDSIAAGVLQKQAVVTDAMSTLKDLMKNALSPSKQIARDIGVLTSSELAKGLRDKRPEVRAEAKRVRGVTEAELATLILKGGKVGKEASQELANGLRSKNPAVRAEAQRVQSIVTSKLNATKGPAGAAGATAGEAYAAALRRKVAAILKSVLADIAKNPSKYSDTLGGKSGGTHARGGTAPAHRLALFGEEGPELGVPQQDMHIFTASETARMFASGEADAGGGRTPLIGSLTVVNPAPEPASTSVSREMRKRAYLGAMG